MERTSHKCQRMARIELKPMLLSCDAKLDGPSTTKVRSHRHAFGVEDAEIRVSGPITSHGEAIAGLVIIRN